MNGCEWLTKAETIWVFFETKVSGDDEYSTEELLLEQTGDSRN